MFDYYQEGFVCHVKTFCGQEGSSAGIFLVFFFVFFLFFVIKKSNYQDNFHDLHVFVCLEKNILRRVSILHHTPLKI